MKTVTFFKLLVSGCAALSSASAFTVGFKQSQNRVTSHLLSTEKNKDVSLDMLEALERAAEADGDLSGVMSPDKRPASAIYMDKEAHRHDSLLDEIQHAIDNDPDLVNVVGRKEKADAAYMDVEKHRHDSFLNEIEHSIDTDPDL